MEDMGPRAALIAVVALAGCGALSSAGDDTAPPVNDMNASASDMAVAGCAVVMVDAVDATTGMPKATAPARLIAVDVTGGFGATWTVTHAGDGKSYVPMPTDSSNLRVQLDAAEPGTWTFHVMLPGRCGGSNGVTLGNPTGRSELYRFRAMPPESNAYTMTDTAVTVTSGTPLTKDLTLDPGTQVAGVLQGPSGGTPGEVRFVADSGPDAVTVTAADGSFQLAVLAMGMYTPLLIPSSTVLAPHLGQKGQGATFVGQSFVVGGGASVSGTIVDGASNGVAGARVVLRAGLLPSGTGVADVSGAFTLHAEPAGSYVLSFGADGWPQGTLAGVTVPPSGTSVSIAYTVGRVAVGGSVVGSDGAPVPNARVTITSRPLGSVASVVVGGGAAMPAQGRVARVVTTDGSGALPALQLPLGTYDLVVEPPGPSLDGLTAITQTLAGAATWTLHLSRPVTLAGTVRGPTGQGVAGARVTAIETVGLGAAPMTTTDGNGHYSLMVDRGAPVQLLVEPAASDKLAGVRESLAAATTSADIALGPGLAVSGVVHAPTGAPVPAVRVDALCWSCGSTTPVASAVSDGQGVYRIYLPDPGPLILDGGAGD